MKGSFLAGFCKNSVRKGANWVRWAGGIKSLREAKFGIDVGTGAAGQAIAAVAEDRAVAPVGIEGLKDEGLMPAIEKS